MTRKFHPSSYSGTKEALEAQVRVAAPAPEPPKSLWDIPLMKGVLIFALVNAAILAFADKDDVAAALGGRR